MRIVDRCAGVGIGCGVLGAGVLGAVFGLFWGVNEGWPPGLRSACFGVLVGAMYLGPVAALIGGVVGAAYGLGLKARAGGSRREAEAVPGPGISAVPDRDA